MLNLQHGRAYLAKPQAGQGNGAGILLLHAWWGLNDVFTTLADRLAAEGFVVLAPDLYDGEIATTPDAADALRIAKIEGGNPERVVARLDEALDYLKKLPEVTSADLGVIGFSMGAAWALVMADHRSDVVGALVLFYGTYNNDWQQIRAVTQGHFAANDEFEPGEGVRELEQTLKGRNPDTTFFTYPGAEHWFFEPDRPQYQLEDAQLAWDRTVKFLKETLSAR